MKPRHKTNLIIILCIFIIIIALGFGIYLIIIYENDGKPEQGPYVIEVIDGDTFKMSDSSVIRLLCVNTPEQGEEDYNRATSFLESMILYRNLRLEEAESLDKVDKYNRDLRFVYVNTSAGEIFINAEIVRLGFGDLYTYQDESGECVRKIKF